MTRTLLPRMTALFLLALPWLALAEAPLTGLPFYEDAPQAVRDVARDLCADEKPKPKPAAKMEASSCPECAVAALKTASGLGGVNASAAGLNEIAARAGAGSQQERFQRDLDFLEYFLTSRLRRNFDVEKLDLEKIRQKLAYIVGDRSGFEERFRLLKSTDDEYKRDIAGIERLGRTTPDETIPAFVTERLASIGRAAKHSVQWRANDLRATERTLEAFESQLKALSEQDAIPSENNLKDIANLQKHIRGLREKAIPRLKKEIAEYEARSLSVDAWEKWFLNRAAPPPADESLGPILEWLRVQASHNRKDMSAIGHNVTELHRRKRYLQERLEALESGTKWTPQSPQPERLNELEELFEYHAGRFRSCGMTIAEAIAIGSYTGEGYREINDALRSGGEKARKAQPYREAIDAALKKLKPYHGLVSRGVNLPQDRLAQHQVGAILEYPGYTSASLGLGFENQSQRMTVHSKTGRYVGFHSMSPGEYEVLFPAGTKFKVLERKPDPDGTLHIVMEEVDQ